MIPPDKLADWTRQPATYIALGIMLGGGVGLFTSSAHLGLDAAAAFVFLGGLRGNRRKGSKKREAGTPFAPLGIRPRLAAVRKRMPTLLPALAVAAGMSLSACAPGKVASVTATTTQTLQGLCKIDEQYQPITVQIVGGLVPLAAAAGSGGAAVAAGASAAISADETTIHPLIVQACQSMGAQAVASAGSSANGVVATVPGASAGN